MKNLKVLGFGLYALLLTNLALGQTLITNNNPGVPPFLNLRSGTFSNRTQDGYNLNNGSSKIWTFFDQTSWNSQFYNSNPAMPAYTEGNLVVYSSYDFLMNYRLLFPVGYNLPQNANYKYPLILFVHGAGERGNCWGAGNSLYNTTSSSASGNITTGTTTLSRTSGTSFSAADRGKNIRITGPSSAVFTSYITSFINSNTVTIAHAAPFTASGNVYTYGWGRFVSPTIPTPSGAVSGSGSISAGTSTFTSNVPTFNSNDVSAVINIGNSFDPCAVSFGAPETRITSVISPTQVTLSSASASTLSNVSFRYGLGTNPAYRGNDLNLVHAGNEHLQAVYRANGKLAEDPTLDPRGFPGFVVAPQSDDGSYYNYGQFEAIVDLLVAQYNIDPDRIYIHGLSNGGTGTWNILKDRPELFAAALPMSAPIPASEPIFNSEISKAVPIPTWIFQGGTDGAPTVNQTNQKVDKLRAAGGTPLYTIYPTVGHGTWGYAYAEPNFFSWMLKQNKRNITVLYGDSTLCPTDASGVKLALSVGFQAYQWELDGVVMSSLPLTTSSTITVTQPGTYRARFSRISTNPSEPQWNAWSKPVVIRETSATTPVITATGTSHLPDVKGGNTTVRINGPTKKDLKKNWYVNNVLSVTNPLITNIVVPPPNNNLDSANYTIRNTTGVVTLKTIPLDACSSLSSNAIYVTTSTPSTLIAPANPIATATTPNSVQLFWTDSTPDETGFEIYRSTTGTDLSFSYFRLVNSGAISFTDSGLTPATTYYYSIRAVNNTAVSPYTSNLVVTTPGDTQPPTVPQNLAIGLKTLTSINLSWSASTDNTGIQQYQISYTGPTSGTVNTTTPSTTYNVTGLVGNSNYFFTVKAIDLAGNPSQPSNQLAATTIFTGLNYSYSGVNVDLLTDAGNNWNTPEITGVCSNFDISLRRQDDYFNFRFDGYISLPAGDYQFRSQSDDGSMVFIGAEGDSDFPFDPASGFSNNRVFDNDGLHGCGAGGNTPNTVIFSGNAARPITVIMFEKTGGECLVVEYQRIGGVNPFGWTSIPPGVLFSGTPPTLSPPPTPAGLSASATGMSSINLNWSPTSFSAAPYPSNLKVVVLGSSTAEGLIGPSTFANSWVEKLKTWLNTNMSGSSVINLAKGGFTTQDVRANGSTPAPDVTRNITYALSLNPTVILVNLPSNNVTNGIPVSTTIAHYNELKAAADLQGVPILFTTSQPRNFDSPNDPAKRQLLQDEAVAVRTNFGDRVIDIYDFLTDFSNDKRIKAVVGQGDGIHLNDSGHDYIYNKALDKLLQQYKKYEVYRSTDNVNYNIVSTTGINPYADGNLLPSTLYYYKMKATTSGGSSGFSSTVSATTQGDTQAPTVPTSVTIVSSSYTNVGIQWTASTDNVGVVGYQIYANGQLLGTSTTLTYSSTALLPGTAYAITVRAYDASANVSTDSAPANFTTNGPLTFFSKPSSNLAVLTSWGMSTDGSGTSPTSFAYDGQLFKIPSPQSQSLTSALTIGGTVSRVIVENGASLSISQPLTGTINVGSGSTLNVNVDYQPVFETIDPTSTVVFNTYSSVPSATYGNLTLNGTGPKNLSAGTMEVLGNLTLANGVGLKGVASNGTTVKVAKDIITGSSVGTISADNRVTLQFSGSTPQNMTVSSDQAFYKITTTANVTVSFNNTSGSPKTLTLGSLNGGGLDLAAGSILTLGSNHLTLTDNAVVNPTNTNGRIAISNANISLTTTASSSLSSNFYFASSPNNRVQNFMLQATGGSSTTLRSGLEIYDGLKINSGVLNAGGNVTLKSSATASAAIQQIVSGSITGNVNVERYIAPKRVYRYMSTPVAGARVADWQNYFPVTGGFIGGTGNASLFYYVEPAYVAYPTAAMDNTAPLQVGRGYAAFIRENVNPITMVSTGVPNQGTIPFTLTGGTVASNTGYNLIGNPYASDIVWRNTGWASTNVSDIIWVRQNNADGSYIFLNWNRNGGGVGFGTLPNGKIPAGQAFWVQATTASPTLSISESAKTTDPASGNTNFFRSETEVNTSLISLKLINGTNQDYAFVNLTDVGSDLYDKLRDGAKRPNSFFNLSTTSVDNVPLAMNDAGNTFCEKIISVNLQPGENQSTLSPGSYSIQFENLENFSLANIELVDLFLGTTTSIDKNSAVYNLTVTTDVASYTNRLSLKLTRPSMLTNNALTSTKDLYCKSEQNVILSIANSQIGVNYEAISASSEVLSDKVVGNGETIQLTIPTKDLTGQNIIKVRSYFPGCSSAILVNSKTITVSELPSLTAPSEVFGCIGSKVTITANGNGSTYQWVNQNGNQTLSESSKSVEVYALDPISSYSVKAINDNGCQSESKNIVVRADDLERPTITLSSNGVLQTDASRSIQWLLNGNVLSGANDISYSPTQSGLYSVRAANTFCVKESSPIEYLVTGLEDPTKGTFSLSVYPNPSEIGEIRVIGNSSITTPLQLLITDILGKELINQPMASEDFNNGVAVDTKWTSGIYIVRVTQNGTSLHQKVIIR